MSELGMIPGGFVGGSSPSYDMAEQRMARTPTLKDRLTLAVEQAEEKLAAVRRAKELFEKNPDLEELLNIMQRNHF